MHRSAALAQTLQPFPDEAFALRKVRREHLRWLVLRWLDASRPEKVADVALLAIAQTVYADATIQELRRELDYLADQHLLHLSEKGGRWYLKLTYQGVDVVEYTSQCPAGVARPIAPSPVDS